MDVALGAVEQVDVDHLAHPLPVQRTVAVGGGEALCRDRIGRRGEEFIELRLPADAPHLKEEDSQRPDSLPLQHDGGVLPAAILLDVVDVLIGEVHAAGKAHLSVDDEDLPVVAVVVMGGDEGLDGREHPALNAQLLKAAGIVPGQGRKLAGAVVHDPDVHALGGFPGQHLEDPAPHETLVDDEVLEKDVSLCLFQLAQQLCELGFAAGEVGHLRVLVDREAAAPAVEIPCQRGRAGVGLFQRLCCGEGLGLQAPGLLGEAGRSLLKGVVAKVALDVEKQGHAHHGQDGDGDHPCDLGAVVHPAVEDVDHHEDRYRNAAAEVMGQQGAEPPEDAPQHPDLQQHQQQHQPEAAEDRVDDALLALFQEPEAAVLELLHPVFHVLRKVFLLHTSPFGRRVTANIPWAAWQSSTSCLGWGQTPWSCHGSLNQ